MEKNWTLQLLSLLQITHTSSRLRKGATVHKVLVQAKGERGRKINQEKKNRKELL